MDCTQQLDHARSITSASTELFWIQSATYKSASLGRTDRMMRIEWISPDPFDCPPAFQLPIRNVVSRVRPQDDRSENNSPLLDAIVAELVALPRAKCDDFSPSIAARDARHGSRRQDGNALDAFAHFY